MRRSNKNNRRYINPTSIAVVVATAVGLVLLGLVAIYNAELRSVSQDTSTKLVEIPRMGLRQVAHRLKQEGMIRNALAFRMLAKINASLGKCPAPKAGFYDLSPSMSSEEILQRICAGKVARRKVTFPEGFTVRQMAERVEEELKLPAADFMAGATGARVKRAVSFPLPKGPLEGYLFPATYSFPVGETPELLASEMVAAFNDRFAVPYAAEIRKSRFSVHELVTLASLVEREARVPSERSLIAGVMVNRLQKKMRLQVDATVQYALGKHKSRLLYRDLKVDSPYNTYLHAGLPPGPICNPGLDCLKAALRPAKTPYLFYVARANGTHVFTKTYQEHLGAVKAVR